MDHQMRRARKQYNNIDNSISKTLVSHQIGKKTQIVKGKNIYSRGVALQRR
jgi:hypothetical protein